MSISIGKGTIPIGKEIFPIVNKTFLIGNGTKSIGKRMLLSNIKVHLEQNPFESEYFDPSQQLFR